MNELQAFEAHLRQNEKSPATIEKYLRDVRAFLRWLDGRGITKERTVCYKEALSERYKAASVNAMLSGVNSYLSFLGHADCRVKPLPVQRSFFADEGRELSREEYARLVAAARGTQLFYVLQTICGTGIRVSELRHITAEAVDTGRATVRSKGKTRVILLSDALRKLLRQYRKTSGVSTGCLFLNAHGGPLDRFAVWRQMKRLCRRAGVDAGKVFPHALRHLFARVFYAMEKDLLRLADLLGHSSINTTRIYTLDGGRRHAQAVERVCRQLLTEC